jgi:hypothetical protein
MYFASNTIMILALVSCGIIFWLFCAYTCASLARGNGESSRLWFFIGLITGPIGLVFAWLYFRLTGERHKRIRHGAGHKYDMPEIIGCPSCGQSVPSAFQTCQFCGAPLHGRH